MVPLEVQSLPLDLEVLNYRLLRKRHKIPFHLKRRLPLAKRLNLLNRRPRKHLLRHRKVGAMVSPKPMPLWADNKRRKRMRLPLASVRRLEALVPNKLVKLRLASRNNKRRLPKAASPSQAVLVRMPARASRRLQLKLASPPKHRPRNQPLTQAL